jgi:hypothetical protein
MFWSLVRKGLCYTAAAYFAVAVMGTFMSLDVPCVEDLAERSAAHGLFLTSLSQPVECLAINAARDNSFSPPRQCQPRMVLPAGFYAAGSGILCAVVRFITRTIAHNKKNDILLKLRI